MFCTKGLGIIQTSANQLLGMCLLLLSGGAGEAWGGERTDSGHTAEKQGQNSASMECPAAAPASLHAQGMWSLL